MFMARQYAHIGTTGRTSARLAVSPVLFNVMLKKKFQKRFSVESCHAIGRFIEDRCEPRGLALLKSRILCLEAELEKSRTALKTAWQDGGQEALDELEAQLCAPETANNIVLGAKVAEKTLRNLFCSIRSPPLALLPPRPCNSRPRHRTPCRRPPSLPPPPAHGS